MSSTNLILNQKTRSVLLSPSMFDGATIISSSGSDAGFPIDNLKDFQPKRKWHHSPGGDPIQTHFIVDLGAASPGRVWNCAIPLFHNGFVTPETNRWRIRTGDDPTGVGFFDSDWMPLWDSPVPTSGGNNNYQAPGFYRTRGLGTHSHFVLPRQAVSGEVFGVFLEFRGGSVGFGDVLDLDGSLGPGTVVSIACRFRFTQQPGFAEPQTILQKGVSDILTGAGPAGGGYSIGLRSFSSSSSLVVAFRNASGVITTIDTFDFGAFLEPGWNDVIFTIDRPSNTMGVFFGGEEVASVSLNGGQEQQSASPLVWGQNSTGGQVSVAIDLERVLFIEGQLSQREIASIFETDLRGSSLPAEWVSVYPNDAGLGTNIEDVGPNGFDGTISGNIFWSNEGVTPGIPTRLFNRYARFDFESQNTPTWILGRFFMGLALEPITPYGTPMPTPLGTPPKPQVTWPARLTRDQFESIAYALAADSGNNPTVLESWGHDSHLIDGGKTVVSVNNIEAEFPWQRQQQTVYGYISSLDEVRTLNTGLIEANLTVRGM